MDEVIEKLCEKLGVTGEYFISELARQSITMDWIEIFFWIGLSIIITIICIILKDKLEDLFDLDSLWSLTLIVPIVIYFVTLIAVPLCVIDLISWHISPIASAIKYIGNCF